MVGGFFWGFFFYRIVVVLLLLLLLLLPISLSCGLCYWSSYLNRLVVYFYLSLTHLMLFDKIDLMCTWSPKLLQSQQQQTWVNLVRFFNSPTLTAILSSKKKYIWMCELILLLLLLLGIDLDFKICEDFRFGECKISCLEKDFWVRVFQYETWYITDNTIFFWYLQTLRLFVVLLPFFFYFRYLICNVLHWTYDLCVAVQVWL